MVIELKSYEARKVLENFIKHTRIDNEHINCILVNTYSDEEVVNILNAADKNNKYVITEMKEAKEKARKAEEENILKQIEALKASIYEV